VGELVEHPPDAGTEPVAAPDADAAAVEVGPQAVVLTRELREEASEEIG